MPGARGLVRWAMAVSEHPLAADDIEKKKARSTARTIAETTALTLSIDRFTLGPARRGDGDRDAPEPPPEKRQKLCKPALWTHHHVQQFSGSGSPSAASVPSGLLRRTVLHVPSRPESGKHSLRHVPAQISQNSSQRTKQHSPRALLQQPCRPLTAPQGLAVLSSICTRQQQGIVGIHHVRRGVG